MLQANKTKTKILTVSLLTGIILAAGLASAPNAYALGNRPEAAAVQGLDGLFTRVSALAPSFGGMFLDADKLTVYLTNPGQRTVAEQAIAAVFGPGRMPAGGVQVLKAQYRFSQLKAWHDSMGSLFNIEGVIFTDLDEAANRLKVGVETNSVIGMVHRELHRLGIPAKAVNVVVSDPVMSLATLRDLVRPIEGGLQINFPGFLCSLSFIGVRAGTAGFAVASHCTNTQGGVENTPYYQPLSPNFIGTEIADPVYLRQTCRDNGIKGNRVCRFSDSAFAQKDGAVSSDQGFIARTDSVNTGSLTIAGQFRITSEGASVVGQTVNKVGRTTGWTQGVVTNTCVHTGVSGTKIVQLCQDFVSATVAGGDSGSPVFAITSGTDVQLRGTLWGGNQAGTQFVYSPIANIERPNELGPITTCASGFSC